MAERVNERVSRKRDGKAPREPKEAKELKDPSSPKEGRESRETASTREAREVREVRESSAGGIRDERRKQILQAAVKVFADKGYADCRISEIAEEAGVAYGLVYHYFGSKEALLSGVFESNWAVFVKALDEIAALPTTPQDKLRQIIDIVFNAFAVAPSVVKVLVLEFGRSARFGAALDEPQVSRVFITVARIFSEAEKRGQLRPHANPALLPILFLGALESALAAIVVPSTDESSTRARFHIEPDDMKAALMETFVKGLFVA